MTVVDDVGPVRRRMIAPFKRPRVSAGVWSILRDGSVERGHCYRYAFNETLAYLESKSPRPALRVVHGLVDGVIGHAWIERGGFAYDWQMMARDRAGQPIPIADYHARYKPHATTSYTGKQVISMVLSTNHLGPWADGL